MIVLDLKLFGIKLSLCLSRRILWESLSLLKMVVFLEK